MESTNSRLARNRATARTRRERKKHEAEKLTFQLTNAKLEQQRLMEKLDQLDERLREEILANVKREETSHPRACLFCDARFAYDKIAELVSHLQHDHATELKNLKNGTNNLFACYPEIDLGFDLDLVAEKGEVNGATKEHEASSNEASSVGDEDHSHSSLPSHSHLLQGKTEEEKRQIRLQKNAESARLCRQRKKLYIQKLRLELPKVEFTNRLLKHLIKEHATTDSAENVETLNALPNQSIASPRPPTLKGVIPKLSGWDHTERRYKHGTASGDPNMLTSAVATQSRKHYLDDGHNMFTYAKKPCFEQPSGNFLPNPFGAGASQLVGSYGYPNAQSLYNPGVLMDINKNLTNLALANNLLLSHANILQNLQNLKTTNPNLCLNSMPPLGGINSSFVGNGIYNQGLSAQLNQCFSSTGSMKHEGLFDSSAREAAFALTNLGR